MHAGGSQGAGSDRGPPVPQAGNPAAGGGDAGSASSGGEARGGVRRHDEGLMRTCASHAHYVLCAPLPVSMYLNLNSASGVPCWRTTEVNFPVMPQHVRILLATHAHMRSTGGTGDGSEHTSARGQLRTHQCEHTGAVCKLCSASRPTYARTAQHGLQRARTCWYIYTFCRAQCILCPGISCRHRMRRVVSAPS